MTAQGLPRRIHVAAYSGFKANERPLSFILDGHRRGVSRIIDRWYGVEHDYFKVVADDGKVYLLRCQRILDQWFVDRILERMGRH